MKNILIVLGCMVLVSFTFIKSNTDFNKDKLVLSKTAPIDVEIPKKENSSSKIKSIYDSFNLQGILNYKAFEQAIRGYDKITAKNKDLLTIIDFTLPSSEKRMYVLDLKNKKLLFHTIVSHGRNTGNLIAKNFSNKHGSFQSSLGFYKTSETYQGGNGFSLRLDGLEKGINDQARARAVVIHGADYCSENMIKQTGRLGRSYGCPALPREINKQVIEKIKNGSILYIYANNEEYMANSSIIKNLNQASETMLASHEEIKNDEITLN